MNKLIIKSDLGTDERVKDESFRDEPTGLTAGSTLRRRILSQSLIDRYYNRQYITSRQYNTAIYLLTIYTKGTRSNSMNFGDRVDSSSSSSNYDAVSLGFSEFMRVTKQMPSDLFKVIQWIVIEGSTATSLDQKEYNSRRVSMKKLKLALNYLADYFGIA